MPKVVEEISHSVGDLTIPDAAQLPNQYNPDKGLKSVAVAEAAERYYLRAKDSTKLYEAIASKLGEQRNFVVWWDGQEKNKGGGDVRNTRNRPVTGVKIEDFGLDRMTVSRWRKKLKDPHKFDDELKKASERCLKICEARSGSGSESYSKSINTGENEWYTPPEHIEIARQVLGEFNLDPASSDLAQDTINAGAFFTKEDDGLARDWIGKIWLNPPYSQPDIAHFVSKLVSEFDCGNVTEAIMLTHNYTDNSWFHEAASRASAICFTRGRVRFVDTKGNLASPTQGQAFFYFGDSPEIFKLIFSKIGFVCAPL